MARHRRVRARRGGGRRSAWPGPVAVVVLVSVALVASCSDTPERADAGSTSTSAPAPTVDGSPPPAAPMAEADAEALAALVGTAGCDELDAGHCLLPFPSDRFTVADAEADTGRRVRLPAGQLANVAGAALDPTEWNRNDGFSPGTPMMATLPGVDLAASDAAPLGDLGRSIEDDSPTVVVDLTTGDRLAHWAELDAGAPAGATPTLILRGAAALPEGHEIGVALRGLVDASGDALAAPLAFRAYRDNLTTDIESVEARRADMEDLFAGLAEAGVERSDLQLAWRFSVASAASIAGPLLAMRDDAFDRLGSAAPTFVVDQVVEADLPPGIGRRVLGHVDVPLYLDGDGAPGSRLVRGADGDPAWTGTTFPARFTCQIPADSLAGPGRTARPVVYGHGLMGSAGEAENSQVARIASTNQMLYCATDWLGMSAGDIGNVAGILGDMSRFPTMAERGLQGILATLFLARAMRHDDGFSAHPGFRTAAGQPVVDGEEVYFDGNSQGHIMGGAATAVSQEWTKAVLGVGGMNYSLLLDRSVDFDSYFAVMRAAYPDRVDQLVIYGVIQMLWDRIEGNGYAQHLTTSPYPDTPAHRVLLHVALGDHQVTTWSAEIQARTIGARLRTPALADGRHPDTEPFWGLEAVERFPTTDSVLVYWDSGTLTAPTANVTPVTSEAFRAACGALDEDRRERDARCADSHEDPRRAPDSIAQKDAFFRPDGRIEDTCRGEPCRAPNRFTLDY